MPQPSPDDDEHDRAERAALWSASFHRFFGARYGREDIPRMFRPMSCGETTRALETIVHRPAVVRRCMCQMLASGYVPEARNQERFGRLARVAVRAARSDDEALAALRAHGLRENLGAYTGDAPTYEASTALGAPRRAIAYPTVVTFRGDVFTVRKEHLVPGDLSKVGNVVRPQWWPRLGPFWKKVTVDRDVISETFVVNWNLLQFQAYDVRLKLDFRKTPDLVRTAYSLIDEKDDELLVDEGYGEARRDPAHEGWTHYTAEKTLKFASNLQNLLSPGLLAMFLESHGDYLHEAFDHAGHDRQHPHGTARRTRH